MSIPKFSELGKLASDLLREGYNFGQYRVDVKTKTNAGVELTTSGLHNVDSGLLAGCLELKYLWTDYGLTLSDKWTSDNVFIVELKHEDKLLKGLNFDLEGRWILGSWTHTGHARAAYKNDYMQADIHYSHRPFYVKSSLVVGYKGWMFGVQIPVDAHCTPKSVLGDGSLAAGYSKNDLTMHWALCDGRILEGSVFHRVNDRLETGVELGWTAAQRSTFFGFGAKYCPDKDTTVRVKLQSGNKVGMSYQYNIQEGISLTLSALLETRREQTKGHKFGLSLDFTA